MKFSSAIIFPLVSVIFIATACVTPKEQKGKKVEAPFWLQATKMVIADGSPQRRVVEGSELSDILESMAYDTSDSYRAYEGTEAGYLLIDGIRYRFNMASEKDTGYRLISIYRGAEQIRLIDSAPSRNRNLNNCSAGTYELF